MLKSLFRVLHLLVLKNWAYTHNFKDLVELISQCGGNFLKRGLGQFADLGGVGVGAWQERGG